MLVDEHVWWRVAIQDQAVDLGAGANLPVCSRPGPRRDKARAKRSRRRGRKGDAAELLSSATAAVPRRA